MEEKARTDLEQKTGTEHAAKPSEAGAEERHQRLRLVEDFARKHPAATAVAGGIVALTLEPEVLAVVAVKAASGVLMEEAKKHQAGRRVRERARHLWRAGAELTRRARR